MMQEEDKTIHAAKEKGKHMHSCPVCDRLKRLVRVNLDLLITQIRELLPIGGQGLFLTQVGVRELADRLHDPCHEISRAINVKTVKAIQDMTDDEFVEYAAEFINKDWKPFRIDERYRAPWVEIIQGGLSSAGDPDNSIMLHDLTEEQKKIIRNVLDKNACSVDSDIFQTCTAMHISPYDAVKITIGEVRQGHTKKGIQFPTLLQQYLLIKVHVIEVMSHKGKINISSDQHVFLDDNMTPVQAKDFIHRLKIAFASAHIQYCDQARIYLKTKMFN